MKNGFTLIELMIVVAIIGILAAIAIPQYQCRVNNNCSPASYQASQQTPGTRCSAGYEFDVISGRQIISSSGGGIPCKSALVTQPASGFTGEAR